MINDDMPSAVSVDYVLKFVGNSALLNAGQNASFLVVQNRKAHFYHQLIQDYFAAIQLINNQINPGSLLQPEGFKHYWQIMGGKWKYAIIAWSGLVNNIEKSDSLLEGMTEYSAAVLIGNGYSASTNRINKIIDYFEVDFGASDHRDFEGGISAIQALGNKALPFLIDKLKNGDNVEQYRAVWVLGQVQDPSSVPALISMLSNTLEGDYRRGRICDEAALSLKKIGTQEALLAVDKWRQSRTI
jgi:hypothetical protein